MTSCSTVAFLTDSLLLLTVSNASKFAKALRLADKMTPKELFGADGEPLTRNPEADPSVARLRLRPRVRKKGDSRNGGRRLFEKMAIAGLQEQV
jgi:hypothetical protein